MDVTTFRPLNIGFENSGPSAALTKFLNAIKQGIVSSCPG